MRKTNTLFKSFSMIVIAILLVASLIITSSQSLNVHAESAHVHTEHCHHEDVEVGEFEGMVVDGEDDETDEGQQPDTPAQPAPVTGETDPSSCTCGCTVYACSQCWEYKGQNDAGQKVYNSSCSVAAGEVCPLDITSQGWYDSLMSIVGIVDSLLNPILIIGGTAGMIFVIILGVNFSKAESADKREEAKKRMINAIIGVVITLLGLILIKLFTANAEEIVTWINRTGNA